MDKTVLNQQTKLPNDRSGVQVDGEADMLARVATEAKEIRRRYSNRVPQSILSPYPAMGYSHGQLIAW